jgi:GNAT superfamily N-acetyltransferase
VAPVPATGIVRPPILDWVSARFDRALMILGDATEPLRPFTRHWVAFDDTSSSPVGLAARFEGFAPLVSVVADAASASDALLRHALAFGRATIVAGVRQTLPAELAFASSTTDPWLVGPCSQDPIAEGVVPLREEGELRAFYAEQDMRYWSPAMLRNGHAFGIRADGRLVCAVIVNFILHEYRYAQIGALATHPDFRGRSFATRVLSAARSSLAEAGIRECGVLADAKDPELAAFYARLGFAERGAFRFIESEVSSCSTREHC